MRAFVILLVCAACGSAPPARSPAQRTADDAPALAALRDGNFDAARSQAATALALDPHNSQAAAIRALALYIGEADQLQQSLESLVRTGDVMGAFDHERGRATWTRFANALAAVDNDLAVAADDPQFSLELCLACWKRDWNHTGDIDDKDQRLLQIEIDGSGNELPDNDPRRTPTFHFDVGDVDWARAMIAFQRAGVELVLAYDWTQLDKMFNSRSAAGVTIKLFDAGRVTHARELVLAGVGFAARSRTEYLAETDDDREWLPNPRQKSHPIPLPVDDALYAQWALILDDVKQLAAGDQGLSMREIAGLIDRHLAREVPDAYVDVGAMFREPQDIVIPGKTDDLVPARMEHFLRGVLGHGYADHMTPSPLVQHLARSLGEIETGADSLEHKLRYLLWLN